jgi:hypothetical protein
MLGCAGDSLVAKPVLDALAPLDTGSSSGASVGPAATLPQAPDGNSCHIIDRLFGERHIQRADGSTVWLRLVSQYAEERFGIARHTIVVAEVRPAATWRLS